jgi:precorrin-2 dehydrogenase/sirohydrochlorin ferrochelatase
LVRSGFDHFPVNFRYPIFLDLSGKRCLVTGVGYEIAGKIQALVDASAIVTYVNPTAEDRIAKLVGEGRIRWEVRDFVPKDLKGCFLVVTDLADNSEVFRLAEEKNILCNAVDDPAHCRFSFGSVHRQGDLSIAISTNGLAPAMAVRLREWLEREVGHEYADLLEILKSLRPEITRQIPDFQQRRALWYRLIDSEALPLLKSGENERAKSLIREMLAAAISSTLHSDISGGGAGQ